MKKYVFCNKGKNGQNGSTTVQPRRKVKPLSSNPHNFSSSALIFNINACEIHP